MKCPPSLRPTPDETSEETDGIGVKGFTSISPALHKLPDFLFSDLLVPQVTSFSPLAPGFPIRSHEQETWSVL